MSCEVNKKVLMDKFGFDEEDLVMLFDVFLKSSNENLEKLKLAIETNDYKTIYICAHSLKGSSGNLLIDEIYVIVKDVEAAAKDNKFFEYTEAYDKLRDIFSNIKLI